MRRASVLRPHGPLPRSLRTTAAARQPRGPTPRRSFAVASASAPHPPPPPTPHPTPAAPPPQPSRPDLHSHATSLSPPAPNTSPLPDTLQPVYTHLATTFLPRNQPLSPDPSSSPFTHVISFPQGSQGRPHTDPADEREDQPGAQSPETVMALASPFEGGEFYVQDAVQKMANELDADVVNLDLVLGVALDGAASPLGIEGPPALPSAINPVYQPAPSPFPSSPSRKSQQDLEGDDPMAGLGVAHVPVAVLGGGGGFPGLPMPGMGGDHADESLFPGHISEEWISFFSRIINTQTSSETTGKKRIILLDSSVAMSKTFSLWWPSLVEAVQRRRRGQLMAGRRARASKGTAPELLYPTTIVLQCAPSPLLSQTSPSLFTSTDIEDKEISDDAEGAEDENSDLDSQASAVMSALEDKLRGLGFNVHHQVEVVKPKAGPRLWWGSEEGDVAGRKEGNQSRLRGILGKDLASILPSFDGEARESQPDHPLKRLLGRLGPSRADPPENNASPLVWKAYPIIPLQRNFDAEKESRASRKRLYTAALLTRAVHQLGGELKDPLQVLQVSETTGMPLTRKTELSGIGKGWGNSVVSWSNALHMASIALGKEAIRQGKDLKTASVSVTWADIIDASKTMAEEKVQAANQISSHLSMGGKKGSKTTQGPEVESQPQPLVDPVVENLKKDKKLGQHEKRLLNCIVDPTKLASTTFKDVHLPDKTVDGIRSMISLPLLYPEAFRGGVLKDHATTGALLFGPPGTGKTLLARAVAAESGARMLAVQPSDVNDMYVGEGEKLVKAVFSLARRLSPCVVFLDEVDALFGARTSRGSSGSMSHNLILTEFMQEMDGLSSAIANKDKRVVIVGATNRPFDLDDAVLRRLPRRLLVDLPGVEGRKAILGILLRGEEIGDDVDLDKLANDTDGFSGSDLKHLCVSAAISAVKDTVPIPWLNGSGIPSAPTSASDIAAESSLMGRAGSGGGQAEVLVVPTDGGGGGRKKAKVVKEKAPASATTAHVAFPQVAAQPEPVEESNVGEQEGVGQVLQEETEAGEQRLSAEKSKANLLDNSEAPALESASENTAEIQLPKRVLLSKHFKVALSEIRPSASEEGSLPELRKWAEQFGEGGKRKGRKSGFGKGFGFGDLEETKGRQEGGYGRVRGDEE
ncbi:hypothetical protein I350_05456 [Cryptococcus amylolentus CBS 6273]|uniref:AAA+ ATPase domain-containing protein n=1 Tax=Cryptococcus amylolentus CBS 6273 TaxID=1296118 RepID=A0A1E3JVU1_9TREE|nr:hypothetical protein I350_05456 [Cryptococcus amylolentus CBS 6273]